VKNGSENENDRFLFQVNRQVNNIKPYTVELYVYNKRLTFLLDTGSSISAIPQDEFQVSKEIKNLKVTKCEEIFKSYVGDTINPSGTVNVNVKYKNIEKKLTLFIVPNGNVCILERDGIEALQIGKWAQGINMIVEESIINEYKDVFYR